MRRIKVTYLKKLRLKSGLTQAELSEKMGYTTAQFISNIERGVAQLPTNKFKLASKILGVSARDLVIMRVKLEKAQLLKRFGGEK